MADLNVNWNKVTPRMSVTVYVSRRWLFRLWLAGRLILLAQWVYPGRMSCEIKQLQEPEL